MSTIPTYAEPMAGKRATEEEKESIPISLPSGISILETMHTASAEQSAVWLKKLQAAAAAVANENMFGVLMAAMFEVGGSIGGICRNASH